MANRKRFVLVYGFIAAVVLTVGAAGHLNWSEQFYLALPLFFLVRGLSFLSEKKQEARSRITLVAIGLAVVLVVSLIDISWPSPSFGTFGRTLCAYALLAIVLMSMWLYVPFGAVVSKLTNRDDPKWKRITVRTLGIIAFSFVVYAYLLSFLQTHVPKRSGDRTPAQLRLSFEDVAYPSRDGVRIAGWYIPSEDSDRAVVLCHGMGADRTDMLDFALALHDGGYSVLMSDFRGHGASGGYTVSYGPKEKWDIISGVDYLKREHPDKSKHVFGVGWSMGAASLVLAAANDERIEGLYIDAVFASAMDMAKVLPSGAPPIYRQVTPYTATVFACAESGVNLFGLDITEAIKQVNCPVMFVHGEEDKLIPIAQGRAVYESANQPKKWRSIPGAGHCGTIGIDSPNYEIQMIAFLDAIDAKGK
ncbi:MAG: alpha/beta fold hydrolase [Phycisphaerae bacterium]|nr:alpha/beta fold hydrolase [Phycisphaerales bacterium]